MVFIFAHAGHAHEATEMSALDHCMPIIVSMGVVITLLLVALIYLLCTWQPKSKKK